MEPMTVLGSLLFVCIVAMGVAMVWLARGAARDKAMMHKTLGQFADRILTDKDDQMERKRIEAQIEIGSDYMEAQKSIARIKARGVPVQTGPAQPPADVRVPFDEDGQG